MKKQNYVLREIKENLKKKNNINNGYAEVLYSLYMNFFNFSYTDKEWINADNLFSDNPILTEAFSYYLKIEREIYYNFSLSSAIGTCLGAKKINSFILAENKKARLLNYTNYFVCDYNSLSNGDNLNGIYYAKDKNIDNLVVIAIKNSDTKSNDIIDIYETCGFTVNELKTLKTNTLYSAIKSAKKSKVPVLIIVNNIDTDKDLSKYEKFNFSEEVRSRTNIEYKKWLYEYDNEINARNEKMLSIINYLKNPFIDVDLENIQYNLGANYENTITASSDKIFGILKEKSKYISLVEIDDKRLSSLISIGLSITGIKPNLFIDNIHYVSDLINLANKNDLPVNFIVKKSDKSFYMRDLNIYNPCDMREVIGCWSSIIKSDTTSVMLLSNKETTLVKNTNLKYVKYGAYLIKKEEGPLHGIIASHGEDLKLALGVAGLLEKEGIMFRVVTIPCVNLLLKQRKYSKELLNPRVNVFVLDKNVNVIYNKFTTNDECLISSNLGLDKVKEKIKEQLRA